MKQTIKTIAVILFAGAMITGCDYKFQPYAPPAIASTPKVEAGNANYLEDLVDNRHSDRNDNTAVDIAAKLSEKYGQAVDKLNNLQNKHMVLLEKDKGSQIQISKLQTDITRAEKELKEANTMLLEMREELTKWKKDVLSFRSEMRMSQKATLEGLTRLHVLISGGVAMDPAPVRSTVPIAAKTKENNGANPR
jgi:hypothetical protein